MKIISVNLTFLVTLALVGCVADEVDLSEDEAEVLVSTPDAGEESIVTPCDPVADPHCERSDPGPGGGAGGGGGGGGGAGNDPACFGSNNNWCRTHLRCERITSCVHPSGNTRDWICHRDHGDGECLCIYYPPYLTGETDADALVDETEKLTQHTAPPVENIITPCDPVADPHCERSDPGPGGGAGGGGGGGGGNGGQPSGWVCPNGFRWTWRYGGRCVAVGTPCNGWCDTATEGICTINENLVCECSGGTGC